MIMTKIRSRDQEDDVGSIEWKTWNILHDTDGTVGGLQAQPQQCWLMSSQADCVPTNIQLRSCMCSPCLLFVCAHVNTCLCLCVFPRMQSLFVLLVEVTLHTGRCWQNLYFPNSGLTQQVICQLRLFVLREDTGDRGIEERKVQTQKLIVKMLRLESFCRERSLFWTVVDIQWTETIFEQIHCFGWYQSLQCLWQTSDWSLCGV